MADRPIIFSASMVRALLDGRKTQTRRVVKPQPLYVTGHDNEERWYLMPSGGSSLNCHDLPYAPGDRLWAREALDLGDRAYPIGHATYAADGSDVDLRPEGAAVWAGDYKRQSVPSIHMPRWASRLTLHVTNVRVQRLQEISEADAVAEGCDPYMPGHGCATEAEARALRAEGFPYSRDYRSGFQVLWNSLHGPDAWDANPWVCAVSFTVERANIDATGAGRAAG
jgi:hypothetical protein